MPSTTRPNTTVERQTPQAGGGGGRRAGRRGHGREPPRDGVLQAAARARACAAPRGRPPTHRCCHPRARPAAPTHETTRHAPHQPRPRAPCLPSSHAQGARHRKNWLPLVSGPALAMDSTPGASWRSAKLSSWNVWRGKEGGGAAQERGPGGLMRSKEAVGVSVGVGLRGGRPSVREGAAAAATGDSWRAPPEHAQRPPGARLAVDALAAGAVAAREVASLQRAGGRGEAGGRRAGRAVRACGRCLRHTTVLPGRPAWGCGLVEGAPAPGPLRQAGCRVGRLPPGLPRCTHAAGACGRRVQRAWHMKPGMMRWKMLPLKCSRLPLWPTPRSPAGRKGGRGDGAARGKTRRQRRLQRSALQRAACALAAARWCRRCAGCTAVAQQQSVGRAMSHIHDAPCRAEDAPVHSARKFSAVRGATSERSSITTRPAASPPISMSRNTRGSSTWAAMAAGGSTVSLDLSRVPVCVPRSCLRYM